MSAECRRFGAGPENGPSCGCAPRACALQAETFDDAFRRELGHVREVETFVEEARRELAHARAKHPGEEGVLTDAEWLAVLTEEVGECARSIQDEDDAALRRELAQVAAVATRWALSIPRGRVRPPWAGRS